MYAIFEIQTNDKGVAVFTPIEQKINSAQAESSFLMRKASACVSEVYIHTVICIDEHGNNCFGSPAYYEHIPSND